MLWPGEFVDTTLRVAEETNVPVAPTRAVLTGQEGQYVFVLKPDQTVEMRPVVTGQTIGQETVIQKGLQPGETVVTDGQLRLVNGAAVEVKQEAAGGDGAWKPKRSSGMPAGESTRVNISEIFIRRPIMTTLVMTAILLFGIVAYRELPVSDLPNVDFPTITVNAALPGADPDTMAAAVATPLERQFSTIAGLDSMTSVNTQGSTSVTLQFSLARNLDAAAQDVQAAIAMAQGQLPPDMPNPPSYRKANPADQPVLYLALSSPTLPLSEVNEYAETMLAQRISMVSGVAQVQVFGSQKYAVRIQLDPRELANRGIGLDEVVDAVRNGNVNLPTGVLWGKPSGVFGADHRAVDGGVRL